MSLGNALRLVIEQGIISGLDTAVCLYWSICSMEEVPDGTMFIVQLTEDSKKE